MKNRLVVFILMAVLIGGGSAVAFQRTTQAAQTSRLVGLLPASDAVAVFDAKRFFGDALPRVLAANPSMLTEITARLAEMESRTGIDLRKFEQVAVGATIKSVGPSNFDLEPVAIASGDINAGALIAVGRLASKGAYREEKVGDKTVYVFTVKDVVKKTIVKPANTKVPGFVDDFLDKLSHDIAVAAIDKNTVVMGPPARVRETLLAKSRVAADITGLLSTKETAVMSFAAKVPGGLAKLLPLDNDELGANIDSIQYATGSLDVTAAGAELHVLARTRKPEQATSLKDTLEGLQMLGGAFLGASSRPDQQVYARMIKAARVGAAGTDVTLDLLVPQSDIDILIGGIK